MPWLWGIFFSFGAMTFLFPVLCAILALPFEVFRKRPAPQKLKSIDVLIPAYNEEDVIVKTLNSVHAACLEFLKVHHLAHLKITVVLDGSTDKTPELAKNFASENAQSTVKIEIRDRKQNKGKWNTLVELVTQATHSWCAIVDAGTLWPATFLLELNQAMEKKQATGFAPGYRPQRASLLEKLVWLLERTLKRIENLAGGPVSVHGATMIFETLALQHAFSKLNTKAWLNDDVVLALQMRAEGKIHYFGNQLAVFDSGVRADGAEIHRRKRMVRGNLEWIAEIFPSLCLSNPFVALLSMRRIFRVLWAYLLVISGYCAGRFLGLSATAAFVVPFAGAALFFAQPRLRDAALASLLSPYLVLTSRKQKSARWI